MNSKARKKTPAAKLETHRHYGGPGPDPVELDAQQGVVSLYDDLVADDVDPEIAYRVANAVRTLAAALEDVPKFRPGADIDEEYPIYDDYLRSEAAKIVGRRLMRDFAVAADGCRLCGG